MPTGAEYSHLHQLLIQLKSVQDHLARGPKVIKARQKKIEQAEAAVVEKEGELKQTRSSVDKLNLNLKTKETHLQDLQGKLNTASSNREFDIIRGQMDADKAAKAVLEDEILEMMDRVDVIHQEIHELNDGVKQTREETQQFAIEFEAKANQLRDEETALKARIQEAEKVLPNEVRAQYKRLVESYGPDALADATRGSCENCFVNLTAQNRIVLNGGGTLFCASCGRLLYSTGIEN